MIGVGMFRRSFVCAVLLGTGGCGQIGGDLSRFYVPPPVTPSPPEPIDFSEDHVTVQCGGAHITAEQPVRIPSTPDVCDATYMVKLSVETDASGAMLMDFVQQYVIADWRIRRTADRIQHDMEIHWKPGEHRYRSQRGDWRGRLPMVVRACPEGDVGPVLACSGVSCALYSELDDVPPLDLDTLGCLD